MRTLTIVLLLTAAAILATGCASGPAKPGSYPAPFPPVLLFDRIPGTPTAGRIVYGRDWPSTPSRYEEEETVYYTERVIDIQRSTPGGRGVFDHTYRRFDTVREGHATR